MLQSDEIAQWHARVFAHLLPAVLVLGAISALPSVALAATNGEWQVAVVRLLTLAWVAAIWRLERAPYELRATNFLAAVFLACLGVTLKTGPAAFVSLIAAPILAVILLGMRPAILMLVLCGVSLLAMSIDGRVALHVSALEHSPLLAALLVTFNFLCVGALIVLACGMLLKGLAQSLVGARQTAADMGQLNQDMRLTSEAIARLSDMVLIARMVDAPGATQPIIFVNDAFLRHTGYAREDVIGRSLRMFEGPGTVAETSARMLAAVARKEAVSAEVLNYKRNGESFWAEVEMVPFASDSGAITHWVIVGRDTTERHNTANEIHRLAYYDALTGLPNRRRLMERLAALVAAAESGSTMGALLYVDLDNFKTINDARGHATGDQVLTHAADRLGQLAGPHDTVARLGGDEFVVLLGDLGLDACSVADQALARAEQIRCALVECMHLDGQRYYASASIGVALATHGDQGARDLLREADIAMYQAKALGRNGVALFHPSMLEEAERRLALERGLDHALENGELAMHLQLQVGHDGKPCGAELLMRWRRADGSSVAPDVFIPAAESSGQIIALGEWALRQACLAWHALERAGHPLALSVNVSPVQFRQPDFVARVEAILHETGVPPGQLIFEVTEGLLVARQDEVIGRMRLLDALGIRISVDDFGTGYSSLAYLIRMPLYELKIDKSFIRDTPHDRHATAIVQSVLSMAGHLGLRVVAEGVETPSQAAFLAGHANASMQGWLFHRPMALDDLLAELRRAA